MTAKKTGTDINPAFEVGKIIQQFAWTGSVTMRAGGMPRVMVVNVFDRRQVTFGRRVNGASPHAIGVRGFS
jgi:hypothetical protein